MRAPCPQARCARDYPVPAFEALGAGAGGEDLEAGFVAGDGDGVGGSEGGGEGGEGRVGALDLVDVGRVERGGEGAEGEEVGVGRGDGVRVEAVAGDLSVCNGDGRGGGCTLGRQGWSRVSSRRGIWLGCSRRWIWDVGGMGERDMRVQHCLDASSTAMGSI